MKNIFQKLTLVMIPALLVGCSMLTPVDSSSSSEKGSSGGADKSSTSQPPAGNSSASSANPSSSSSLLPHEHAWEAGWEYDDNNHWHACSGCNEKKDSAAHTMGEFADVDLGTLLGDSKFQYTVVNARKCSTCNYIEVNNKDDSVIPELRVTYDPNDPHANFATIAKSNDVQRPKVNATYNITNCTKRLIDQSGTIKVRGNQTAGFDKKGFTIKFDTKAKVLGLSNDKAFRKWVLLADAKDITLSRTALGLTMSDGIIRDDSKVWSCEYTPVRVYLNDQYWGFYLMAEQKESKSGRINLPEVADGYKGTDIGYCFELDYYAKDESRKDDGGDPTFSIDYDGINGGNNNAFTIENGLANSGLGLVKTYTMNSDITDGPAQPTEEEIEAGTAKGTPVNANNSNQVKFIQNRLTALFKILHQAAVNNRAYDINETNNTAGLSTKTVREVIEKNFDLKAWAEGYIINAMACAPDLGYSSFYMSFDNSATGDKKLRFDNPWDFDSNFGNRADFIEKADTASTSSGWQAQTYDPYYMDRTANLWLQMFSKLDFFIDEYVKPLWNQVRDEKVFEKCIEMLKIYYKVYDNEHKKNFQKWTSIMPSDPNLNYFRTELRELYREPSNRKNAQKETINWFTKRVNYFENKWGENRKAIPTI